MSVKVKKNTVLTAKTETFKFGDSTIRFIELDGRFWYVARDIANAMGYSAGTHINKIFADYYKNGKLIVARIKSDKTHKLVPIIEHERLLDFLTPRCNDSRCKVLHDWLLVPKVTFPTFSTPEKHAAAAPSKNRRAPIINITVYVDLDDFVRDCEKTSPSAISTALNELFASFKGLLNPESRLAVKKGRKS